MEYEADGDNNSQWICCIAVIQLYTYTCGNIINNNDERTHFFRKIYLSHFIRNGCERVPKGLCVRGELETEQTATYWPSVPLSLAALLSRSAGQLNRGVLRTHSPLLGAGSLYSILSPTNWLQLTRTVCRTGLYHCLTPTCFLWASHLHPIQPVHGQGYILMSSTGCTCFSIDGWAEGQYVTDHLLLHNYYYYYHYFLFLLTAVAV